MEKDRLPADDGVLLAASFGLGMRLTTKTTDAAIAMHSTTDRTQTSTRRLPPFRAGFLVLYSCFTKIVDCGCPAFSAVPSPFVPVFSFTSPASGLASSFSGVL